MMDVSVFFSSFLILSVNTEACLTRIGTDPLSATIDFRRHILTSVDVRIWRLKSISALKELNMYNDRSRPIKIVIQMKRKHPTKKFYDDFKLKKHLWSP